MLDKQKINIEKRIFKVGNNENFILEYPSNFEEIANKKLLNLQKEYDDVNKTNNIPKANIKEEDNNYYQPINKEYNEEIKDEINNQQNKEMKLEPQEGFIEIKKKDINKNEESDDEDINSDEFYEVEEKEKKEDKNKNNINNYNENNNKEEKKRNISPVKDPDNIILSMEKLNFKAPKWAENMSDNDFINMVKNKIHQKK